MAMQVLGATSEVFTGIPSTGCRRSYRSIESGHRRRFGPHHQFFDYKQFLSSGLFKGCRSFSVQKVATGFEYRARGSSVRASEGSNGDLVPLAPLAFDSAIGQFLAEILQTHPHLLVPAADQQLENLQNERDAAKEENVADDLLYKRIAEVKEKERHKTLVEIIYCLIVQKFVDNNISMIPKITETSDPTGRVDFWPNQEIKLESVHSPEAFEMIQGHLSVVLGDRMVGPLNSIVKSSKIKLGKLYAASIMYGYFLRRVDERYQLERTMKTLPKSFPREQVSAEEDAEPFSQLWDPNSLISVPPNPDDTSGGADGDGQSYRLRSYVMYLDAETLQRYATMRSNEATSLIEKQTQALFGRPDIRVNEDGTIDASNDEVITVTFSGLTMLILEAVAFGSFLWDTESYVESKYHFVKS